MINLPLIPFQKKFVFDSNNFDFQIVFLGSPPLFKLVIEIKKEHKLQGLPKNFGAK